MQLRSRLLRKPGAADPQVQSVRDLPHLVEHRVKQRAAGPPVLEVVELRVLQVERITNALSK